MSLFKRIIVIAPARSICSSIFMVVKNNFIPKTLLMQEKEVELSEAIDNLKFGGFGVVAGTGTGKTVFIRDIIKKMFDGNSLVDVVTREFEATDYTWTCNVLIITPGIALNWLRSGIISKEDLIVIDEIHQTSEHLELSMALAKRQDCTFVWMSATVKSEVYAEYLRSSKVIECKAFDISKKSKVIIVEKKTDKNAPPEPETFLRSKVHEFIEQQRTVVVFVSTRAKAEKLAKEFGKYEGLYSDFYHGGEKVEKLNEYLSGNIPKPFMVFMTNAGSSSLNIPGLNTVVIDDETYESVVHSGVTVLQKSVLSNNRLLQSGGRVNGRQENSEIYITTTRSELDFHSLEPTTPDFCLGENWKRVALICARLGVNAKDLELISPLNHSMYEWEVERFRERGVIEKHTDKLTNYGRKIERLPVDPAWAELLVNALNCGSKLVDVVALCSCVNSFYSLVREGNIAGFVVKGSDHLTLYNIISTALNKFAVLRKKEDGLEYAFNGNWIRKYRNTDGELITERGEFVEWCHKNRFDSKAIAEVALAMKSVYYKLGLDLPDPAQMSLVEEGSDVYFDFLGLLAKVQSQDFVFLEKSSKSISTFNTVWPVTGSLTRGSRVLGKINYWEDKKGVQRASVEGTEIPEALMLANAQSKVVQILDVTENGIKALFYRYFAGERIGEDEDIVPDSCVDDGLVSSAQMLFIEALMNDQLPSMRKIVDHNKNVLSMLDKFENLSSKQFGASIEDIRDGYIQAIAGKRIFSVESFKKAVGEGLVTEKNLMIEIEDFVSAEILAEIESKYPAKICVDDLVFELEYIHMYDGQLVVRTWIEEDVARSANIKEVIHPNGQAVKLNCRGQEAASFDELNKLLDRKNLEQAIKESKKSYEKSFTGGLKEVFACLPEMTTKVFLVKDLEGEDIFGYLSFYFDGYSSHIQIQDNQEVAEFQTNGSVKLLFSKTIAVYMEVPQSDLFYKTENWYRRILNDVGENYMNRLEGLKKEYLEVVDVNNIEEKITAFMQEVTKLKNEFFENSRFLTAGLKELSFSGLINGKRVEELSSIFKELEKSLGYSEEVIVKSLFEITHNGCAKKGNKLWMALKDMYPGKIYGVNVDELAFSILEAEEENEISC